MMGIFNKRKNSEETRGHYNELVAMLNKWDDLTMPDVIVSYGREILSFIERIDSKSVNKEIIRNSKKFSIGGRYLISAPGSISSYNTSNPLSEMSAKIRKIIAANLEILEKEKVFVDEIMKIPFIDIYTQPEERSRNKMVDMPSFTFSPIGKRFDPEKLPVYISLDIETTGLKGGSDRIIQVSAIRIEEGTPTEIFSTYTNPQRSIPPEATAVNGITNDMVQGHPTFGAIAQSLENFIKDYPLIGYNLMFDLKFLFCSGMEFQKKRKLYDVYDLAKKVLRNDYYYSDYTLKNVADYYDITFPAHNSISDSFVTHIIFQRLLADYCE